MLTGCLIGESLKLGVSLEAPNLRVLKIARADVSSSAVTSQPGIWTVIDFEADDADADALASALTGSLEAEGGWYADFRVGADHVVVFANRVFRYRRGDATGRAEVVAYGRTVGVPDHQLDWPE